MSKSEQLIRVFNKGTHTFQYAGGTLKPGTFGDVTKADADLLCGFTQNGEPEVVLGSELPATVAPGTPDAATLKKLQVLQDEKMALATQNAELEETTKGLQAQIDNLEKMLKKAQHKR